MSPERQREADWGLSIADSFTRFCGGDFHVKIRGDQFTVEIAFVKY